MRMHSLFSLRQLACFAALAETRSFRRAAERVGMSQPSLSAQIRNLEDSLALDLVERRSAGAELTPIGRDVLAQARAVLEAARALEDFASGAQKRVTGRIRLGVSPTIGPYLMPEVVGRLHRLHPELRLFVRESPPADLARELSEGEHDAVLTQLPLRADGMVVTELFRERLLLILAADNPLAATDSVAVDKLAGLDVLTLDPRFQLHDQVAQICETHGARLARDYEGGSLDALRLMTGMNAGVAFVPELYARSEVRAGGDVVVRPLKGRAVQRMIGLAWRRSFRDEAAIARIAEIARTSFSELLARPFR